MDKVTVSLLIPMEEHDTELIDCLAGVDAEDIKKAHKNNCNQ